MSEPTTASLRTVIGCAASAAFLTALDGSVVTVSLPSMAGSMGADMGTATWVSAGYMVALSCSLLPAGRLVDNVGPRTAFTWGFIAFVLTSAGCGAAWSMASLVLLRLLQGLAAGVLIVAAFAVIPRAVPAHLRTGVFSTMTAVAALGVSLGGPLGGALTEFASWRWVFLINIPVGLATALLAQRFMCPDAGDDDARARRFDPITALAGAVALGAALVGLNRGDEWGWFGVESFASFGVAVAAGAWFLHSERAAADPLVAWDAAAAPEIRRGFLLAAMAYLYLAGFQFLVPFELENHRGYTSAQVGGALLAYSLPLMAAGTLSGRVSGRLGLRWSQAAAMCLVTAGSLVLAVVPGRPSPLVGMGLCGVGFGLFTAPNNAAVMSASTAADQGRVAGTFQTIVRVAIAAGFVCFEALHSLVRRTLVAGGRAATEADARGFEAAYAGGALLCLLVAAVALLPIARAPSTEVAHGSVD